MKIKGQLSVRSRPITLDGLIGQEKVVRKIRGLWDRGTRVNSWLLFGPRGSGKTTTARILALAYQCTHQKVFGAPCKECISNRHSFDIVEINAAKVTGVREIEEELSASNMRPRFGNYRVYILDEAHRMSSAAQDLALKYVEEPIDTTVYILCSTAPDKITETLQSRCKCLKLQALDDPDNVTKLVEKLLSKTASPLPADRLVDALVERGIKIPRLIAHAVENYISGSDPEEAVEVEASSMIDIQALVRSTIKGDWGGVRTYLYDAQLTDAKAIRLSVMAYLRGILLNESELSRGDQIAAALIQLSSVQYGEDIVVSSTVAAVLHKITSMFAQYKR